MTTAAIVSEKTVEKPFASVEFGFWIYLMTDAIIFALLFATYVIMVNNTAAGPAGPQIYDITHTAGETLLLLLSSLVFGLGYLATRAARPKQAVSLLLIAALLGAGFVAMEINEFLGMVNGGARPDTSGYLTAFFTLVGTHGLHVSIGIFCIVVMVLQILLKGLTPAVQSRVFRVGLFWHFLDIVWIGIFSIVYLPAFI